MRRNVSSCQKSFSFDTFLNVADAFEWFKLLIEVDMVLFCTDHSGAQI